MALLVSVSLAACSGDGGEGGRNGVISTVVGTGVLGTDGVGGPARDAELETPVDLAFAPDGSMYIAERQGTLIVKVDPAGVLAVVAGTGSSGFSGDGGPAAEAELNGASAVATDAEGNVYIADTLNNRVRMIDGEGVITTVAGTGVEGVSGDGGPATAARLSSPGGIAIDRDGNLYINDGANFRIRRVERDGTITTVVGTGSSEFSPDETRASEASFGGCQGYFPCGLDFDAKGRLYFTDFGFTRIRFIDDEGLVQTVAGDGHQGFSGDRGPAIEASLYWPMDIAFGSGGELFISTYGQGYGKGQRIRAVDKNGTISTVVGTGATGYSGDGGPAIEAELYGPSGVATGPDGNLYIADSNNNVIRIVEF